GAVLRPAVAQRAVRWCPRLERSADCRQRGRVARRRAPRRRPRDRVGRPCLRRGRRRRRGARHHVSPPERPGAHGRGAVGIEPPRARRRPRPRPTPWAPWPARRAAGWGGRRAPARRGGPAHARARPRRRRRVEAARHTPAPAFADGGEAQSAPHDELVLVVRELADRSPNGAVLIDNVARTLKARGFSRPPGSPRLVTRLRRIKELSVSPT